MIRPRSWRATGLHGRNGSSVGLPDRLQLTLAGRPLYRFAKDKKTGDVKGNCRDNVFFARDPGGWQDLDDHPNRLTPTPPADL